MLEKKIHELFAVHQSDRHSIGPGRLLARALAEADAHSVEECDALLLAAAPWQPPCGQGMDVLNLIEMEYPALADLDLQGLGPTVRSRPAPPPTSATGRVQTPLVHRGRGGGLQAGRSCAAVLGAG
ncbi:MAG: hypothetical protein H0W81_01900 [Chloroflexi bacterium]|nr:hypothetical protein [Chloroflexota bacterium]